MHVPEMIQQAVAGTLKFSFIESAITASGSGTLSSQKGTAQSEAVPGHFRYIFRPRTLLQPAWLEAGGYLDSAATRDNIEFSIKGTERGGAQWHAKVPALRHAGNNPGELLLEADVDEWWCIDARSVKTSFVRGIVPGTRIYPVDFLKSRGSSGRGATVSVRNVVVEFRDHGNYTEILAQSNAVALPADFVDNAAGALGSVAGKAMQIVYKEEHVNSQRRMCLRSLRKESLHEGCDNDDTGSFWNRFREQLLLRLESSPAGAISS